MEAGFKSIRPTHKDISEMNMNLCSQNDDQLRSINKMTQKVISEDGRKRKLCHLHENVP